VTTPPLTSDQAARAFRAFLASYDARDTSDRAVAYRIRERVHSEIYRRERMLHAEWIDIGGEGGGA
jgi:hypothetical protein